MYDVPSIDPIPKSRLMPTLSKAIRQVNTSQIMPHPLTAEHCLRIDLSATNPELTADKVYDLKSFQWYLDTLLGQAQKSYALGGYRERRNIYRRFPHFGTMNDDKLREYHLGIDIWAPQGTPVYAPLQGKVHSTGNNNVPGDYGGMLILEHSLGSLPFYSLYGHLHPHVTRKWNGGDQIQAGQLLATLGDPSVNVGWPPHLHFQLITSINPPEMDFPGVCSAEDLNHFSRLCPNPEYLLDPQI